MTLFYLPLEPYKARYTQQLSAPNWGWMERNWIKANVDYRRVSGCPDQADDEIKTGVVLDCFRRSRRAMYQTCALLSMIEGGLVTSDDVIYLEDFFHPGAEAIPYCCHLKGIKPKVYAYWWAQSVDEYDFTRGMRSWMKFHEMSQLDWLDGVFVACPSLRELIVGSFNVCPFDPNKIHVVGLPFDSEEVLRRAPNIEQVRLRGQDFEGRPFKNSAGGDFPHSRKNQVVFSSRWDTEKNPDFFMLLAETIIRIGTVPDASFVVCTGSRELRSNSPGLVAMARKMEELYPGQFKIHTNLSKEEYYGVLCESKIQFNCADQDWWSFTLLESSVCGCYPIYPRFRSFPEVFLDGQIPGNYLYTHKNLNSAVAAVETVLKRDDLWTPEIIRSRSWIHRRCDTTWLRMLNVMGVEAGNKWKLTAPTNPFDNASW